MLQNDIVPIFWNLYSTILQACALLLRWVNEVGSTSSKYGASNLPSQVYYCNFIFFDSTQGHPWIALHWRGYVWNPMQSAAFWGFVWSKYKNWWGGYHTVSKNSSPYHMYDRHFEYHTILTYSMVQSPSWEANWFAASQEIPSISRNPKVHYHTHKRPPPVSILGQPNQVHIPTSHLLEINPNIIHPSMPRSPQWSSLWFPHQDPIHPPLLTDTCHMPISFSSILSPAQYWVRSTNHLAPRYAVSSIPLLPRPV